VWPVISLLVRARVRARVKPALERVMTHAPAGSSLRPCQSTGPPHPSQRESTAAPPEARLRMQRGGEERPRHALQAARPSAWARQAQPVTWSLHTPCPSPCTHAAAHVPRHPPVVQIRTSRPTPQGPRGPPGLRRRCTHSRLPFIHIHIRGFHSFTFTFAASIHSHSHSRLPFIRGFHVMRSHPFRARLPSPQVAPKAHPRPSSRAG
jgi:hypothetical protein